VRLTVSAANSAPTVREQAFQLLKDPMVALTVAELKQLYQFRLEVVQFQRSLRAKQAMVDTVQRAIADARRAADSAGTKLPEAAKAELAALEKEMTELVREIGTVAGGGRGGGGRGGAGGAPAGAAAGRGGRGGAPAAAAGGAAGAGVAGATDDQNASSLAQANQTVLARFGTLTEMLNATFNPTEDQRRTLKVLPADLQKQAERVTKLNAERLPALVASLKTAGIEVKAAVATPNRNP